MKTMLCTTCGELVPQGCCTCGPKQELVEPEKVQREMLEVTGKALGDLLVWHDAVVRCYSTMMSPLRIGECRAAYATWKVAYGT